MSAEYVYDDSRLYDLFEQLDERHRVRALRGGFRRAGQKVRKAAISVLRSGLRSNRDLERGIRVVIGKRQPTFKVTGAFDLKSGRGFHRNRRGELKPVLLWAEDGTAVRSTKRRGHHTTGSMTRIGFIDSARRQCEASVTEDIHREVTDYVLRTARKNGCK